MPRVFTIRKARRSKKVRKCRVCGHEIQPGETYRYADQRISYPRFGSIRKIWCSEHYPTRHEFEQNPDRLQLLETEDTLMEALAGEFDTDEAEDAFADAASSIEELAENLREKAENIEMGFGHPTELSYEFEEKASQAEYIAQDLQSPNIPDEPYGDCLNHASEEEEQAWEDWREEVRGYASEKMSEVEL